MRIISDLERKVDMEARKARLLKLPELLPAELEELKCLDRALEYLRDPITCVECGKVEFPYQTSGEMQRKMIELCQCFKCTLFTEYVEHKDKPDVVRIEGYQYRIGTEYPPTHPKVMLGHGGQRFVIKFHDGRIVVTHNLWGQGEIPPHFRERLPDNARFGE